MTLTAKHAAMLHDESAIADTVIKARGYVSMDHPDDIRDLGFSKAQSRTAPVLAIPLWNVHGHQSGWQIRPDSPRQMKDGKLFRYETPKGGRLQLDVHPSVQPLLGDPHVPLWITEGVRKGDALVSAGACAIALSGVDGYRGTNAHGGKVILPDWQHVALNDRTVYVAYDSDLASKRGVQGALQGLWTFLRSKDAQPVRLEWPEDYQQKKWGVDDFLADNKTLEDLLALVPKVRPLASRAPHQPSGDTWRQAYSLTKGGEVRETFANLVLALQHTPPWSTDCWYDVVREIPMCGNEPFSDALVGRVAIALERTEHLAIRTLRLVQAALVHHCRARPRDPLKEYLEGLPPWDEVPRLTTWLCDYAGAPRTTYGRQVARLWPVSMVARALNPGCQYRSVIILEGPENLGKSKLVHALAGTAWYRELSRDLESKESHMVIAGIWAAELAELASLSKTEDSRLKSFITMERDDYIPKFANNAVSRLRRTIFIGTVNPEGEGAYLRSQSGNTRFLPLPVTAIDVPAVERVRTQLFAEAIVYYRAHPTDWWQLTANGEEAATQAREARRQRSVYEDSIAEWLDGKYETTWEAIAEHYLKLEAKERWKDRGLQMEIAKALRALGWHSKQQWMRGKNVRVWVRQEAGDDEEEDFDDEEETPSLYVGTGA